LLWTEKILTLNLELVPMKMSFLAAMALALSTSLAFAAEDGGLTTKAMKDLPGNNGGGATADPTAKPDSGSISQGQMKQQPGVSSDRTGTTAMPNAKPEDGSLSGKEMEQNPGAQK
jgi:hypothetical protein